MAAQPETQAPLKNPPPDSPRRQKVILDVDTGVDDALAILYALLSDELEVLGITTCCGNVDVDTATRNTLALVELTGKDVPVYRGSANALVRPFAGPVPWIHGDNGLGNAAVPEPSRRPEPEDAAVFICEQVLRYPGEVVLVPVARMTNLARAYLFDPGIAKSVQRIVMMGGAAFCPGNVTPVAEANIWGDPEAARVLFRSGTPITMVGLDVTMRTGLTGDRLNRMDPSRPYTELVQQAVRFYMRAYEEHHAARGAWCPLHDPLAVAVAEDPGLCRTRRCHVDVETSGDLTLGMTVVDARGKPTAPPNADVCVDVDAERFLARFCSRLGMV
ncbi:MAG: nucleoside hydrolase [Alicyclobacillaceae bacterium]|nr:nucleoside hydrolase [Alicyclobacillaceae bacterium]